MSADRGTAPEVEATARAKGLTTSPCSRAHEVTQKMLFCPRRARRNTENTFFWSAGGHGEHQRRMRHPFQRPALFLRPSVLPERASKSPAKPTRETSSLANSTAGVRIASTEMMVNTRSHASSTVCEFKFKNPFQRILGRGIDHTTR